MNKREIKFRAWNDNGHEHMDSWQALTAGYNAPLQILNGIPGVYFEQYTGLKDADGVEIYEGDYLLTTWDLGDDKDPLEDFGEVQFVDSAWTVVSPNGDDLLNEWVENGTSVQGNIHERPEWRV